MRAGLAWLVGVAILGGCLTAPKLPLEPDGGSDGGNGDGPPGSCSWSYAPRSDAPAFPPAATPSMVALRHAEVVDINCDGHDDLVVANTPEGAPADQGVFVFLGRPTGLMDVYDAFLPTNGVSPYAMEVRNVIGSEHPDLIVTGASTSGGYMLLFEGTGDGTVFRSGGEQEITQQFIPDGGPLDQARPVFIAVGNFDGNPFPDVVLGDLTNVWVGLLDQEWSDMALEGITWVEVRKPDPGMTGEAWTNNLGAAVLPAVGGGHDDLAIHGEFEFHYFFNNGTGNFTTRAPVQSDMAPPHRASDRYPVAADAILDVIGMQGESLTAMTVTRPDQDPVPANRPFPMFIDLGDDLTDGIWAGNLDDDPRPDLVILDVVTGQNQYGIHVVENLSYQAGELRSPTTPRFILTDPGFLPTLLTIGNFANSPRAQIYAITRSGEHACYVRGPTPDPLLTPCP